MPTESGFSNQKMLGPSRHKTVQTMGSDRVGIATAQMYLYEKTPVSIGVVSVQKTALTKQTKKEFLTELLIEFDSAHNAKKFDILRMVDGVLEGWEYEIIKVVDATHLVVYNIGDVEGVEQLPIAGDLAKTLRWTTALSDQTGALQVSNGPVQYVKDGSTAQVVQDTVYPTNNTPLPAGLYFYKDGVIVPVTDDADPAKVAAIPVEIKAADGTNITINAGDISIQTSSEGVNFDSMRIGDGSGVFLKIEADGSINVVGIADVITELQTLNGTDFATQTTLEACRVLLASIDGVDFATETTLSAIGLLIQSLEAKDFATEATLAAAKAVLDSLDAKDFSTETTLEATKAVLDALVLKDFATEATLELCRILLVSIEAKDFATETTLASILAKLPSAIGQNVKADSLSVTLASDSDPLPTQEAAKAATYKEDLAVTDAGALTFAAPANARWCKIMADSDNADSIRIKIGGAATTASGMKLEPGRSEDFLAVGDISYIAVANTGVNKLFVNFGV